MTPLLDAILLSLVLLIGQCLFWRFCHLVSSSCALVICVCTYLKRHLFAKRRISSHFVMYLVDISPSTYLTFLFFLLDNCIKLRFDIDNLWNNITVKSVPPPPPETKTQKVIILSYSCVMSFSSVL